MVAVGKVALGFAAALLLAGPASAACEGRVIPDKVMNAPLCLPASPHRIVVLDATFSLGMALELGMPVIGAPLAGMTDTALHAEAEKAGVADLGSMLEPSIESVVALQPDLIIGASFAAAPYYDMLSMIAPTALIDVTDWKEFYATVAAIGGREAQVGDLFAAYDRRIADIRARVPDIEVSILRITSWDFQVYLDGPVSYAPFTVLREAGVRRTDYETTTDDTSMKRPDWEELTRLDGDILLYIIGGLNPSDTDGRHEEVLSNPLWRMLPAVRAGNVHRVDAGTWMEFSGLASAHRVLDDVERYILPPP